MNREVNEHVSKNSRFWKFQDSGSNHLMQPDSGFWITTVMQKIQYGKYDLDHNGQLTEDELITAQNLSDRTPEEEKEMNS